MIIGICGIKRSGSTAQYNMVRLVCEASGQTVHTWGNIYKFNDGINIVKVHKFDSKLYRKADYIFTTDRKDEEIKESMARFSDPISDKRLKSMRRNLSSWETVSHKMHYSHIVDKPLECIEYIAEVLGFNVDCKAVYEKFKAIKPPKEGYDDVTFLFHNHRSNNHE